jgi:hypothetical protein
MKFDIWIFLGNSRENSSVIKIWQEYLIISISSVYIFDHICSFIRRMRNVSDKSCREYQDTHFRFNNFFFSRKVCRLWDDVE